MNRGSLPGNHVLFIFPFFWLVFFGGRGYFCISISNSMVPSIEKHWSYPNDSPEHIRVKTFSIIKHWLGNWQLGNLPTMSDLKKIIYSSILEQVQFRFITPRRIFGRRAFSAQSL